MIDLALAIQHLKADPGAEDDLIAQYLASAVSACENYCNRKFYLDDATWYADYVLALNDLVTAQEERDAAFEATTSCSLRSITEDRYNSKRAKILQRCHGLVVDDTIRAAILMMLGHFYRNRQEVVVGQSSGATQLPAGARRILEPYLWIGDLGGGS